MDPDYWAYDSPQRWHIAVACHAKRRLALRNHGLALRNHGLASRNHGWHRTTTGGVAQPWVVMRATRAMKGRGTRGVQKAVIAGLTHNPRIPERVRDDSQRVRDYNARTGHEWQGPVTSGTTAPNSGQAGQLPAEAFRRV